MACNEAYKESLKIIHQINGDCVAINNLYFVPCNKD